MKLILDLDQRPDGRLAGSVMLPGETALRPFWGVLELVARVEELRDTATTANNNRRSTMSQLFFTDPGFEFETRGVLGNVHYGCGDVGEVLATVAAITDGDDSSWVAQWQALARRVEAIAPDAQTRGHKVSARNAYLRAAVYYAAALTAIDGVEGGADLLGPVFTAHRRCFDAHVSLLDPPAEKVAIPYEGGTLPGYLFVPVADGQARPTLILVNGSDGPMTAVWPGLGAPALARGYNALVFDGPGQQSMLFERQVPFRPDWEHVITPVVDFLEKRPEVDAGRLGLYGLSQGGYWVPRALAFEHRIAAAVADPGVDDVAASWHAQVHLPPEMLTLLEDGEQEKFDASMAIGMQSATPRERQVMQWRTKPYGTGDSAYALFKAVEQYRIGDLAQQIRTPIMITDPEGEQFWPGQSRRLYDALPGPKVLVPFTKAEGADMHCEPMARSLVEQRMFDWLDESLAQS
jgi:dienelactone hydrolase